jgi:hypothetical protein
LIGVIGGSFGDKQLKIDCGLSPLNGWNAWLGSVAENVAVPFDCTIAAAGDDPKSQSTVGDHPAELGATPLHCSTNTCVPAVNPDPTMVNGSGFPEASPGTTNGLPVGVEIVPAYATPAAESATALATNATTIRRERWRMWNSSERLRARPSTCIHAPLGQHVHDSRRLFAGA